MLHVSPSELLHPALQALPDVTLAIDPPSLRIVDVNRAVSALGYPRAELLTLGLDALLECPRDDLARFVRAADGRAIELPARWRDGARGRVSARAATSAGAAAWPCVLLVLREVPEHARALEQIERLRGVLTGVLDSLEQLSDEGARIAVPAPLPAARPSAPTGAFRPVLDARGTVAATDLQAKPGAALPFKPAEVPDLSIEQYAMLTVELETYPARRAEILGMSGIFTDSTWLACEAHWAALLVVDPGLRQRWLKLGADFRNKLSAR
jgi:hypothetical protein